MAVESGAPRGAAGAEAIVIARQMATLIERYTPGCTGSHRK
jgi:hypothetical protein